MAASPTDPAGLLSPQLLRDLERLAARAGLEVRREAFDAKVIEGRGGLCRVRGRRVIVMEASLPLLDQTVVLAAALAAVGVEALFLPPFVRARVKRLRGG